MVGVDEELIRYFGSNVRMARERAGMTLDALALMAGIPGDLLRSIEQGSFAACEQLDLRSLLRLAQSVDHPATLLLQHR